jgi:SAM-dependent methyltransferase
MTMDVLQNKDQIEQARAELERRGLSALESTVGRALRKLRLNPTMGIGDEIKSWDVLRSVEFIEKHLPKQASVLDIGAFASEILSVLYKAGYRNLAGVDLNPKLRQAPYADTIRYEISDFMQTPFEDASFDAVTSISVIEHGFQSQRLLRETSRLLRPGGYFIASFDYWPQKIDVGAQKFFGMDWLIFSEQDVRNFIEEAVEFGLRPAGSLRFEATERAIDCVGQRYTFGWLVLQKSA